MSEQYASPPATLIADTGHRLPRVVGIGVVTGLALLLDLRTATIGRHRAAQFNWRN